MRTITLYHSAICPRCRLAGLFLDGLLPSYPDVRVERVEYLTNMREARAAGVRSIPTLVAGGRVLTGFLLTKSRIRAFLEEVAEESAALATPD